MADGLINALSAAPPPSIASRSVIHDERKDYSAETRRYDWAQIRAIAQLKAELVDRYSRAYIYRKQCSIPFLIRDVLGDMISPPADARNGSDLLDATSVDQKNASVTIIKEQLMADAYQPSDELKRQFADKDIEDVRTWITKHYNANSEELYNELHAKRTAEVAIIEKYLKRLQQEEEQEERQRQAAAAAANKSQTGAPSPVDDSEDNQQQQQQTEPIGRTRNTLPILSPAKPRYVDKDRQNVDLMDALHQAHADLERVKAAEAHILRENAGEKTFSLSLEIMSRISYTLPIIMFIFAIIAQDGAAVMISMPVGMLIGIFGTMVSHEASQGFGLWLYTHFAAVACFFYLVYAILRSTIYNDSSVPCNLVVVVLIWLLWIAMLAAFQYSASMMGLSIGLLSRQMRMNSVYSKEQQ